MPGSAAANRYALRARRAGIPNLLEESAVAMCGWVRASTSGLSRKATGATCCLRTATRESCSSSSSLSQLNCKMPASSAAAISSSRLPDPEELAAGDDVEPVSFAGEEREDGQVGGGLHREAGLHLEAPQGGAEDARVTHQRRPGVDVRRRSDCGGQLGEG